MIRIGYKIDFEERVDCYSDQREHDKKRVIIREGDEARVITYEPPQSANCFVRCWMGDCCLEQSTAAQVAKAVLEHARNCRHSETAIALAERMSQLDLGRIMSADKPDAYLNVGQVKAFQNAIPLALDRIARIEGKMRLAKYHYWATQHHIPADRQKLHVHQDEVIIVADHFYEPDILKGSLATFLTQEHMQAVVARTEQLIRMFEVPVRHEVKISKQVLINYILEAMQLENVVLAPVPAQFTVTSELAKKTAKELFAIFLPTDEAVLDYYEGRHGKKLSIDEMKRPE